VRLQNTAACQTQHVDAEDEHHAYLPVNFHVQAGSCKLPQWQHVLPSCSAVMDSFTLGLQLNKM
jgi:hypothetical protein